MLSLSFPSCEVQAETPEGVADGGPEIQLDGGSGSSCNLPQNGAWAPQESLKVLLPPSPQEWWQWGWGPSCHHQQW